MVFTYHTSSERSDSRSNTPPRRRSRSRSVDRAAEQLGRLHICNFDESLRKDDLKDAFGYFFEPFFFWETGIMDALVYSHLNHVFKTIILGKIVVFSHFFLIYHQIDLGTLFSGDFCKLLYSS